MTNRLDPITYCEATSARTGERCCNAAITGERLCNVHRRQQDLQSSAANGDVTLDRLPEIDTSSTPDQVLNRWLRSRDERTRFFAAKTLLDRARRAETSRVGVDIRNLSDVDFRAHLIAVRAHSLGCPPRATKGPAKAYDVMASLKTSRDARISVGAALELETYEKERQVDIASADDAALIARVDALIAQTDARMTQSHRPCSEYLALQERVREAQEFRRREAEAANAAITSSATPTTTTMTATNEPRSEITINNDGGKTERVLADDGRVVLVREHRPPRRHFDPFELLEQRRNLTWD